MNKAAFLTASRFTRKEVVTVSFDRIDFAKQISAGNITELLGKVVHIGNTSLMVLVQIFIE